MEIVTLKVVLSVQGEIGLIVQWKLFSLNLSPDVCAVVVFPGA
jgi:hypothetical protein